MRSTVFISQTLKFPFHWSWSDAAWIVAPVLQEVVFWRHTQNGPSRWWRWEHSVIGSWEGSQAAATPVRACVCTCVYVRLHCLLVVFQVVWAPNQGAHFHFHYSLTYSHGCICMRVCVCARAHTPTHHSSNSWGKNPLITSSSRGGQEGGGWNKKLHIEGKVDHRSGQQRIWKSSSITHRAILSRARGKDGHRQIETVAFLFPSQGNLTCY